jgi:hypothetical protein
MGRSPTTIPALLGLALVSGLAPRSAAQQHSAIVHTDPPKPAVAIRVSAGAIALDGRLTDEAWRTAAPIGDFVQRDPHEGQPATEPTEARVLYTDAALYVGVRAFDSHADQIKGQLTRRDQDSPSDWILVAIDSYHDRRTAFVFAVNPAGVKRDVYLFDDVNDDESWNAVWEVAVSRDSLGWTAEFEIPLSQLRFARGDAHEFGFNVVRMISRLNEEQHWRLIPKNQSGVVSRFGDLIGINGIRPPRRLEVQPYVVAQGSRSPPEQGNPFATGRASTARVGGDLLYGVTSNLTLTATINPDFGQVEADPAVVNLSAFETFFQEKRPFFTEGLDVFRFNIGLGDGDGGQEELFYTRRIGRAPQGEADARGGYARTVGQTAILGAAKLSGKTASGWTLGFLGALTAEEQAGAVDSLGARYNDVVEPRTTYLVSRVGRDFRNGQTVLGLFGTGTIRALPASGSLDFLRSSAFALGTNWEHRFRHDTYRLRGWVAGSDVFGSAAAIDETQRSSAHYYQRPDNDYVTYDPTRTSLQGFAGQVEFGKIGGGDYRFLVALDTRSPGFEVNDLGFERHADQTVQVLWGQRRWTRPGKVFREVYVNVNQWSGWTYGWDGTGVGGNVNAHFTFLNYWSTGFGINRNFQGLATGALRGGPAIIEPGNWNGWGYFQTDARRKIGLSLNGWGFTQPASGSTEWGGSVDLRWRPLANLDFTASPNLNKRHDNWQYVDTQDALGTFHYVFADLRQTTVGTQFRGNLTFLPTLSLQLYVEPFIATGAYGGYKEVTRPRAADYADRFSAYAGDQLASDADGNVLVDLNRDGTTDLVLDNPNFRYLSLRGNAVLRWEYRRGSTLFLVWQHGREDVTSRGTFNLREGLDQLFAAPATNTLLVKINYWLSM